MNRHLQAQGAFGLAADALIFVGPASGSAPPPVQMVPHPGVELRGNIKSTSHRCHFEKVAFVWELTKETIHLPLGCLQGGVHMPNSRFPRRY